MERSVKPSRIAVIFIFTAIFIVICAAALYKLQILSPSESRSYEDSSVSSVTRTMPAARGSILDRYGRLLVSDRPCSNIVIDRLALISSPDPNGTLYRLINAAVSLGETYNDTLPATAQRFYPDMTDTQRSRLNSYFGYFDLSPDITSEELFEFFRQHYKIDPDMSEYDARLVIGVRYELEIRVIANVPEYIFANDVGMDLISVIAENDFPGVSVVSSSVREFHTASAAHLLGITGKMSSEEIEKYTALGYPMDAVVGKSGVELAFEEYLHGKDGTIKLYKNSDGAIIDSETVTEPQAGGNVYLTVDIGLQAAAERALENTIDKINASRKPELERAEAGAAVVVDVRSCDVLASASYPSYDPATFNQNYKALSEDPALPLFNRATMGTYSPGSTFKMVTGIAAMQEGVITPYATIEDKGEYTKYADSKFSPKCWIYPGSHGAVDMAKAIEVSCNYYFYTLGDGLGINLLSAYARSFGLGQATGIEIPEDTGILATREYKESHGTEPWFPGDTLQAAIGQSFNQFSPLQLAVYTAAVANGGTRYAATLLSGVVSHDYSQPIYSREAEVLSTVKADSLYFDVVKRGMLGVSKNGTARPAFGSYSVDVASKTGTAQLGEDRTNNAVFVCFAPYENPEIAVAVVVEKGGSGSAAADIAREILDYYFGSAGALDSPVPESTLLR